MKLVAQVQLRPTPEQASALQRTTEAANAACNAMNSSAWSERTFGRFSLQRLCYRHIRQHFGLSAQMTIRCLAKVSQAYGLDRRSKRAFRRLGAIAYDDRILSWNFQGRSVSIWTVEGRLSIPFVAGEHQMTLLGRRQGETDLLYRRGKWFLLATCAIRTPDPLPVSGVLGIDLGVTNIVADSDGTIYSGKTVKSVRHRHRHLRAKLQKRGTKSARRRLRKLSGRERRFATDMNHCLSKVLVQQAERTNRAIALEALTRIRTRARVTRQQRAGGT